MPRQKSNPAATTDDDDLRDMTPKMVLFAQEWPVDWNASKAAIRAGYSPKYAGNIGAQLVRDPRIRKIVDAATQARMDALGVTKDRIMQELTRIAFSDKRKVAKWRPETVEEIETDAGGIVIKRHTMAHIEVTPSDELDDDAIAAVTGIKMTKYGPEVTLEAKSQALLLLGKELGMFKDKVEHSADESWGAVIATMTTKASDAPK
jgi:phage terminase small subunit